MLRFQKSNRSRIKIIRNFQCISKYETIWNTFSSVHNLMNMVEVVLKSKFSYEIKKIEIIVIIILKQLVKIRF